jgi:hypothetical protein
MWLLLLLLLLLLLGRHLRLRVSGLPQLPPDRQHGGLNLKRVSALALQQQQG